MARRVVITGMGVIAPNGVGCEAFWRNCLDGVSSVGRIPEGWGTYAETQSDIWSTLPKVDFSAFHVNRIESMQMDMTAKLSCATTAMALDDAGYGYDQLDEKKNTFTVNDIDPDRWGVLWGTGAGGICSLMDNHASHILTPVKKRLKPFKRDFEELGFTYEDITIAKSRVNPFSVSMVMPNSSAAAIGIKYSLTGVNEAHCSACASGTASIGRAFSAIRDGRLDCAVTGGSEYLDDGRGTIFRSFDVPGTLVKNCDDPETANRPFDKARSGFLFSEGGGAALILEELSHARKRNANIYAEITAFSESFDAHSIMMIEPTGRQIRRMIGDCLAQSGLDAGDIDYINSHGTGTELNDPIEAEILFDIFGGKPLVNSTKSLIGHTIGASGAIETVVTVLSIDGNTTHLCKNLDEPVNELNFVRSTVQDSIDRALTHSFAFGGHNAGLVIERYCE